MKETMCYVGKKPCGCIVTAIADDPSRKKIIGKTLGDWVGQGLIVERLSMEEVKEKFTGCRCEQEDTRQGNLFKEVGGHELR